MKAWTSEADALLWCDFSEVELWLASQTVCFAKNEAAITTRAAITKWGIMCEKNCDEDYQRGVMARFGGNVIKGLSIGAANIVPGLSGGTIALVLGIFERLVQSIRSIDKTALKLLLHGRWRDFARHIDFAFVFAVFIGVLLGNVLLAKLLGYLFATYRVYTWSFFFGLVLASLYFVLKSIGTCSWATVLAFFCGCGTALFITALPPAESNAAVGYLVFCGIIAVCSMILPGLSGSYVLILLGNYHLVMIQGVGQLRLQILGPFLGGALFGVLLFARFLAYLLQNYHSQTMALLCGFIAGSLRSLWPWKHAILQSFGDKTKIVAYSYFAPELNMSLLFAIILILLGGILIVAAEAMASRRSKKD